jgi:hypothetical protein
MVFGGAKQAGAGWNGVQNPTNVEAMRNVGLLVLVAGLGCFAGCSKNASGKGEVKIDLNEQKDAMSRAFKDTEKEIKKGAEKAKDSLQDAGEAVKDKIDEAKDKLSSDSKKAK